MIKFPTGEPGYAISRRLKEDLRYSELETREVKTENGHNSVNVMGEVNG